MASQVTLDDLFIRHFLDCRVYVTPQLQFGGLVDRDSAQDPVRSKHELVRNWFGGANLRVLSRLETPEREIDDKGIGHGSALCAAGPLRFQVALQCDRWVDSRRVYRIHGSGREAGCNW